MFSASNISLNLFQVAAFLKPDLTKNKVCFCEGTEQYVGYCIPLLYVLTNVLIWPRVNKKLTKKDQKVTCRLVTGRLLFWVLTGGSFGTTKVSHEKKLLILSFCIKHVITNQDITSTFRDMKHLYVKIENTNQSTLLLNQIRDQCTFCIKNWVYLLDIYTSNGVLRNTEWEYP